MSTAVASIVLPSSESTEHPRLCNACHRAPTTSSSYSTCRPCREKRAEAKKKANERKRNTKMLLLKTAMIVNTPKKTVLDESSGINKKRKAEGENVADAIERMKKRFKKMEPFVKVDTPKDNSPPSPDIEFSKFQFAKDLHRDINQRYPDYSNSIRFQGTYAIVAFPDIDNKQRARQVARDLRASTDLHFDLEDRLKSHRSHDASKAYTITYQCACRASAPTLKRNPSDLTAWLGSKKTGASDDKVKECRGRIEISAEDDTSHPFVLGQRVKVIVTHPKRAY